ncbi:MAG: DUF3862 domain-containing protein [Eubacteriaceae bacterium]|nr:DUF3862 domain-containing protein [Eubacteriaceae bacterium]
MKKDFILSGTNDQVFEQLKTTVLPLNWSPVRFEPGKNRLGGVDPTYGKILIYLRTTAPGQVSCTVSAASETAADFIINKVSPPAFDDFFSDSDDDDDAGDSIFDDAPSATNTPAPAAQPTASTPSNPAPSQPPVQNEPWYYKTWVVVLFLIFFWPVGLILMWTGKKFPLAVRIILSVFYAISLIIVLFSGVFLGNLASNAVSSTPSTTVTTTAQTSTSSSTTITLDQFNQIQTGMTYDEVTAIVGSPGVVQSEVDIGDETYKTTIYSWDGASYGSSANVTIQGGTVTSKSQYGLE